MAELKTKATDASIEEYIASRANEENSFGLWGRNKKLTVSICGPEECHPDDASMEIIYGVWNKLNGNDIRYKPNTEQP